MLRARIPAVLALAGLLALACGPDTGHAKSHKPTLADVATPLPFELAAELDTGDFPPPSGIVYHPLRKTLFVVNDNGHVGEFRGDGTFVQRRHLMYDDFEAITVDPRTGLLYVAIEGRDDVVEIDPDGLAIRREYNLPRVFEGHKVFRRGGNGVEGLSFAPDPAHPEGGTFWLVNRSAHPKDRHDPPLLAEVELPLSSHSVEALKGRMLRYKRLEIVELSGLQYDVASGLLYAISDDEEQFVVVLTRDGNVVRVHPLRASDPEGITFDAAGDLYIAQDSGGILKFRPAARDEP